MSTKDPLNIPISNSTVRVSIIDTTIDGDLPTAPFMGPPIPGFERWRAVGYAFLVTHTDAEGNTRRVVFDLGLPKDLANDFPPSVIEATVEIGVIMTAEKYVSEILSENGVSLEDIEALILSHAHPDHIGRPSLFPASASLVVGPGVKASYFPGYPAVQESPILAREFEGREVRELDFGGADLEIGGLRALDYFGDGSFYLLSAPGHAVGHINALARTAPDAFIYFAGDSFHHVSVIRPHAGARLPGDVRLPRLCCPGAALHAIHPVAGNSAALRHYSGALGPAGGDADGTPFFTVPETPGGGTPLAVDLREARETVAAVQRFDASPDVLVVGAHDRSLLGVLDFFPADAGGWREKGWKESGRWRFLQDFARPLELAAAAAAAASEGDGVTVG